MATNIIDYTSIDNRENPAANTRWALTALSYANRKYAVPDEVMIDKVTGEIYYKRTDGIIVKASSDNNSLFQVIQEIATAINKVENTTKFEYPTSNTSVFVSSTYHLANRVENTNIINDISPIDNFEFSISKETNGFFIKAISRQIDINFIELLCHLYNDTHDENDINNAEVTYEINLSMIDETSILINKSSNIKLNEVSFINIDKKDLLKDTTYDITDIENISIKVMSIASYKLKEAINDERLKSAPYNTLISDDGFIDINNILVGTYIDNISYLPSYDDVVINSISSGINVNNTIDSSGGMSQDEKTLLENLAKKVNSMTNVYVQRLEPEDWKVGDIWGQIIEDSSDIVIPDNPQDDQKSKKLLLKNATINKDESDEYLIDCENDDNPIIPSYFTQNIEDSNGVLLKLL